MKEFFSQRPKIEIVVECYNEKNENKQTIYKEIVNFDYYSWKDISGIFQLESNEAKNKKYPFILLEIKYDIYLIQ